MEKTYRDTLIWENRPHAKLQLVLAKRYRKWTWLAFWLGLGGTLTAWVRVLAILLRGSQSMSDPIMAAGVVFAFFFLFMGFRWSGKMGGYLQKVRETDRELEKLADAIGSPVSILAERLWPHEIEEVGKGKLCGMIEELHEFEAKASRTARSIQDFEMRDFWNESVMKRSQKEGDAIADFYRLLAQFFPRVESAGLNSYYVFVSESARPERTTQ